MRTCQICSREFTKPYNLRVHHERFHPMEPTPALERMPRKCSMNQRGGLDQVGGGDIFGDTDEESDEDDSEDKEDIEEDDDQETEDEEEEGVEQNTQAEKKDEVFHVVRKLTDLKLGSMKNPSHKLFQKTFRDQFSKLLIWVWKLRRTPVYKKIMETVKELESGAEGYDREEALGVAVRRRKILIDRLNPEPATDDSMSEDDDEENDEDSEGDDEMVGDEG